MLQNFTLENDKLRVISSLFWIGGALSLLLVNLRVLQYDLASQTSCKDEIKHEIERLEKQLQRLKNKL